MNFNTIYPTLKAGTESQFFLLPGPPSHPIPSIQSVTKSTWLFLPILKPIYLYLHNNSLPKSSNHLCNKLYLHHTYSSLPPYLNLFSILQTEFSFQNTLLSSHSYLKTLQRLSLLFGHRSKFLKWSTSFLFFLLHWHISIPHSSSHSTIQIQWTSFGFFTTYTHSPVRLFQCGALSAFLIPLLSKQFFFMFQIFPPM